MEKMQNIRVAVDSVIFSIKDGALSVLLIGMNKDPFKGQKAFPGGFIGQNETTEDAARRILKEETGVSDVFLEQLATFDAPKRDPRGRVISVAYYALLPSSDIKLKAAAKYSDIGWYATGELPKLAYDHKQIAETAINRLRSKLEYSNVAWSLLPRDFTLTELQKVYETILGRDLDKRNFRRKILALGLIDDSGEKQKGGVHRPAQLYHFKQRKLVYTDVL